MECRGKDGFSWTFIGPWNQGINLRAPDTLCLITEQVQERVNVASLLQMFCCVIPKDSTLLFSLFTNPMLRTQGRKHCSVVPNISEGLYAWYNLGGGGGCIALLHKSLPFIGLSHFICGLVGFPLPFPSALPAYFSLHPSNRFLLSPPLLLSLSRAHFFNWKVW